MASQMISTRSSLPKLRRQSRSNYSKSFNIQTPTNLPLLLGPFSDVFVPWLCRYFATQTGPSYVLTADRVVVSTYATACCPGGLSVSLCVSLCLSLRLSLPLSFPPSFLPPPPPPPSLSHPPSSQLACMFSGPSTASRQCRHHLQLHEPLGSRRARLTNQPGQ